MKQLIRFVLVGIFNSGLGYGVIFACMYLAGLSPELSNVIGYGVGLIVSYLLHRIFTFRSDQGKRAEISRFVCVFLVAYLANLAVLTVMVRVLGAHAWHGQVVAGGVYIGVSYLLNKFYVFNRSKSM